MEYDWNQDNWNNIDNDINFISTAHFKTKIQGASQNIITYNSKK